MILPIKNKPEMKTKEDELSQKFVQNMVNEVFTKD